MGELQPAGRRPQHQGWHDSLQEQLTPSDRRRLDELLSETDRVVVEHRYRLTRPAFALSGLPLPTSAGSSEPPWNAALPTVSPWALPVSTAVVLIGFAGAAFAANRSDVLDLPGFSLLRWIALGAQIVAALLVWWIWYRTCLAAEFGRPRALLISFAIIAATVLVALIVNDKALKPALGVHRPAGYEVSNEDPITAFVQVVLAEHESAPSGFMVRQSVIFGLFLWIAGHPESPLKAGERMIQFILQIVLGLAVVWQRIFVGAHDTFDLSMGLGVGILLFWTVALPVAAWFQVDTRPKLLDVAGLWFAAAIALVFFAGDPLAWMADCVAIVLLLTAWRVALDIAKPRPFARQSASWRVHV